MSSLIKTVHRIIQQLNLLKKAYNHEMERH